MTITRFYTAELTVNTVLNNATSFFLSPTHYLFGKRHITLHRTIELQFETRTWLKTTVMVALLIPSLIIGTVLRLVSFTSDEVRRSFFLIKKPTPLSPMTPLSLRTPARNRDDFTPSVRRTLDFSSPVKTPQKQSEIEITYGDVEKIQNFLGSLMGKKEPELRKLLQEKETDFFPFFYCRYIEIHLDDFEERDILVALRNRYLQCKQDLTRKGLCSFLDEKPPGFIGVLESPLQT